MWPIAGCADPGHRDTTRNEHELSDHDPHGDAAGGIDRRSQVLLGKLAGQVQGLEIDPLRVDRNAVSSPSRRAAREFATKVPASSRSQRERSSACSCRLHETAWRLSRLSRRRAPWRPRAARDPGGRAAGAREERAYQGRAAVGQAVQRPGDCKGVLMSRSRARR